MLSDPKPRRERSQLDEQSVTRCLRQVHDGQPGAEDRLLHLVYSQLRRMAGKQMRRERRGHTLQATALANEAYVKLRRTIGKVEWKDSSHFYATCGRIMRNILVDHARRQDAGRQDLELFPGVAITRQKSEELLALDKSLDRLAQFDPRGARVVELTHFLGMTQEEIALHLGIGLRTVKRDVATCMRWLREDMKGAPVGGADEDLHPSKPVRSKPVPSPAAVPPSNPALL